MLSLIQLELCCLGFFPMEMRKYVMFCLLMYFRMLVGWFNVPLRDASSEM